MIERHQLRDVAMKNFNDVKTILSKYDFQTVYAASEGAAAFYVWVGTSCSHETYGSLISNCCWSCWLCNLA